MLVERLLRVVLTPVVDALAVKSSAVVHVAEAVGATETPAAEATDASPGQKAMPDAISARETVVDIARDGHVRRRAFMGTPI